MTTINSGVKIGHYVLGETIGMGTFGKVKSELSFGNMTYEFCEFCERV